MNFGIVPLQFFEIFKFELVVRSGIGVDFLRRRWIARGRSELALVTAATSDGEVETSALQQESLEEVRGAYLFGAVATPRPRGR